MMRLLEVLPNGDFRLTRKLLNDAIPRYAVLSHTWGDESQEVTFEDMAEGSGRGKAGYEKIKFCGEQAAREGLQYFWVDSCCIKKSSDAELSESLNSMFRWYYRAEKCYVYLSDISIRKWKIGDEIVPQDAWEQAFRQSRWFTRGWTLQELLAPTSVDFFTKEGTRLGDKRSLERQIHEVTGVPIQALRGASLSGFSVDERLSWAETRQTTREEDYAYSMLGIFDVYIPLIYGEGRANALKRLLKEVNHTLHGPVGKLDTDSQRRNVDSRLATLETSNEVMRVQYNEMSKMLAALQSSTLSTIRLHAPSTIGTQHVLDIEVFKSTCAKGWSAKIESLGELGFLDIETSKLIEALVRDHTAKESKKCTDLIQQEVHGLISLLHGQAVQDLLIIVEAVASIMRRPLHRIRYKELAHLAPEDFENELASRMFIAFQARAIMLIEEADVLMKERTLQELPRDAMVSVALRLLESYEGILFLTANRVRTFDEAFQSRIHLALHYPKMDRSSAIKVWKSELHRLRTEGGLAFDERTIMAFAEQYFSRIPNWNARQIHDIVRGAKDLAIRDHVASLRAKKCRVPWSQPDQPVISTKHFKRAVKACKYLKEDDSVDEFDVENSWVQKTDTQDPDADDFDSEERRY